MPISIELFSEMYDPIWTVVNRFARKLVVQLTIALEIPLALRLYINLSWETLSNAF